MTNAVPLARGGSASAEAAGGQADIETFFTATIAGGDWAAAPELTDGGTMYKTLGWTRASGNQAVVGGYGKDGAGEQMFIIVLHASR